MLALVNLVSGSIRPLWFLVEPGTDTARLFHLLLLAVTPSVAILPLLHVNKRFLWILQYCEASFVGQETWIAVQKNNWVLGLGSELTLKLRIITFSSYDSSSGPLLQELGWDGLSIRRIKLLVTEIFKVYNNMATDLCQIFLKMRSTYDTRGSFSRFQLPLPKTNSVWQKTFWPSICENRGPQKRSVVWMNWKGQYGGFVYFYLRFLRLKTG